MSKKTIREISQEITMKAIDNMLTTEWIRFNALHRKICENEFLISKTTLIKNLNELRRCGKVERRLIDVLNVEYRKKN